MIDTNALIGIPYVFGGRDAKTGLDCWGLTALALRLFGTPVPCDWDPATLASATRIMTTQVCHDNWCETIEEPGAVAALSRGKWVTHVGVCVPGGVLHTTRASGAVIQPVRALMRSCGFNRVRFYRWDGGEVWA